MRLHPSEGKVFFMPKIMSLLYTSIQHAFRKEHGLSCIEYVFADMVFKLQHYPKSKHPGWCYMSRPEMAEEMDISKQSVIKIIDRLIKKDILVRDTKTAYIKTTEIWGSTLFTSGGKESLLDGGKESLPYNNKVDNNNDNNNEDFKKSSEVYKSIIDFWLKEFHIDWTFTGAQGKALKSLINKIKKVMSSAGREITDQSVVDFFKAMCQHLPEWYKEKDLLVIDSKFNELISEIKKGTNGKSKLAKGESIYRS